VANSSIPGTCVAPDYVLVHKDIEEAFFAEARKVLKEWHGDSAKTDHFGRMINKNHFNRVKKLIESSGGDVVSCGTFDEDAKFVPPTFIRGPALNSGVMQEEIFGPVLPIVAMDSIDKMCEYINANEKPLAMYIFATDKDARTVISRTSSGGVCVNDTIMHLTNPHLPFGGVGNSGQGSYHGKWGFNEFSHMRAVMFRPTWLDPAQRYPPYTAGVTKQFEGFLIDDMMSDATKKNLKRGMHTVLVACVACAAFLVARRFGYVQ